MPSWPSAHTPVGCLTQPQLASPASHTCLPREATGTSWGSSDLAPAPPPNRAKSPAYPGVAQGREEQALGCHVHLLLGS